MLDVLRPLVEHETPSREKVALDAFATRIAERFRNLGAEAELVANRDGGDHVRARISDSATADSKPALVLAHFDTVWPLGTVAQRPFRIVDGKAFGPGIFDMKASLVLVEYALRALRETDQKLSRPVEMLFTSDEEIGSPTSRALIEDLARKSAYVLVLESPLPGGRLKTARKGVGTFDIRIEGRAAHAGIEPEKGVSAVLELANQIIKMQELANPALGTTLNMGVVEGGTAVNVVAAHASARMDVRVATVAEAQRFEHAVRHLKPVLSGAKIEVRGRFTRPPMERTPAIAALFEQARTIGRSLGLELSDGPTGGASDANFTAALGVPTLDGLGALGAGAHAESEHILIDSLPERAALFAALLLEVSSPKSTSNSTA
jgi:glutamate carboxypeptidase